MLGPSGEFPLEFLHSEMVDFLFEQEELDEQSESTSAVAAGPNANPSEMTDQQRQQAVRTSQLLKKSPFGKVNAATKLESMGFRVGYGILERICKDMPRFTSELENMKFVCKDFWSAVFKKQVDNLRTNHQGVYVVLDNRFWLLQAFPPTAKSKSEAPKYLAFSCGMLRGALANLGFTALVTASVETIPTVKFNIHIQQAIK